MITTSGEQVQQPGEDPPARGPYREVRFRHSRDFAPILQQAGVTVLVSTYQAGKLVTIGTAADGLHVELRNFEQAMGMAIHPQRIAVGSRGVIWFLQNAAEFAPRLQPSGTYDACYLARGSFITGNIHGHEMAWVGDELWIVNTLFSCLCTLHEDFSFVPRWRPPYISELEANDRCHLNGLALDAGRPKYVTAMAQSNEPGGWRPTKAHSGVVLDIASGEPVTHGLAMPHSPRVYEDKLWVLHSGCGSLEIVDPRSGQRTVVDKMPGYTRGLAFHGHLAFVGLSRIRETAVFGGVPIAERREELKCGVAVVDLRIGKSVAYLEFESGVEEIFDVQVLPARCVAITGPYPTQDDAQDVWVIPPPGQIPGKPQAGSLAFGVPLSREERARPASEADVAGKVRSGLARQHEGRFAEAVELLREAAALRPQAAEIHNHLGNALQDFGRQDLAQESYQRAIAASADFAPAHQNLGYLLINFGLLDEGLVHLRRAQELQPLEVNRVMLATALPVIHASDDDVRGRRESLEKNVAQLVANNVQIDTANALIPTNFFAAYQGYDDRSLQENLGRIFQGPRLATPGKRARHDGRVRVGFLSAHFRDHTIGRLNLGRVALLDRERFEVSVISIGHHRDEMAQRFQDHADHFVNPRGSIAAIRQAVAELPLDVLFFADVGMNALTYALAFSRMAPIQCVTWGHPVTTGSTAMDYFVSSELLETDQADQHYTERLIRLANLGTYYYRPTVADDRRSREAFGLDPQRHMYFCPQTLFKIHPEFDPIIAGVLRRDPRGDLVLIEGRQANWTRLLKERLARTMPDVAERVRFLPPQPNPDFLRLNALADVLLDTIHFGGGNTSYEGLAVGTPIVTLPGPHLRSRLTLALYRKMNFLDCVANSPNAYIELAVRLGTDSEYRRATSDKIRAANHVLFEDAAEVREVERFLQWAADDGQAW